MHKRSNSDIFLFVLQMQNLDSIILFPVDRLLKTDFRGSKGDMKRPFDRSWKEYQDKYNELERQKKKLAKENGENKIRHYQNQTVFTVLCKRGNF